MKCQNQTLNLFQFKIFLSLFMCLLFFSSFVCITASASANVYCKTTILKQNMKIILIAGVLSSQALLGFLITAPLSARVSAVLGAPAVWIKYQKKKTIYFSLHVCAYASTFRVHCGSVFEPGASGLPYYCTPPVTVPDVIGVRTVWRQNTKKKCL